MTTTQAVVELMRDWVPGEEKLGYEICDTVKARVWASEGKRPLESTIMRRLRDHSAEFGVSSVRLSSRYVKAVKS